MRFCCVAPHVGAWIETFVSVPAIVCRTSRPTWARGLKRAGRVEFFCNFASVAPHVGAWIETWIFRLGSDLKDVAPHVGAWIETIYMLLQILLLCRAPRGRVD